MITQYSLYNRQVEILDMPSKKALTECSSKANEPLGAKIQIGFVQDKNGLEKGWKGIYRLDGYIFNYIFGKLLTLSPFRGFTFLATLDFPETVLVSLALLLYLQSFFLSFHFLSLNLFGSNCKLFYSH